MSPLPGPPPPGPIRPGASVSPPHRDRDHSLEELKLTPRPDPFCRLNRVLSAGAWGSPGRARYSANLHLLSSDGPPVVILSPGLVFSGNGLKKSPGSGSLQWKFCRGSLLSSGWGQVTEQPCDLGQARVPLRASMSLQVRWQGI